jgi:glycosyltransferase involved in cell wall biosynthesis
MKIALVHDYLTQRGGAERVVLSMTRAFPGAPLYTSLYDPDGTFPEFRDIEVRPMGLNALSLLRRSHRLALPLLAPAFSRVRIEADVVICSSSGWAHGAVVDGRKIVYCYTPARWLYQGSRYLGERPGVVQSTALRVLRPWLVRWDRRAAHSADHYLVSSSAIRRRVQEAYGIEAEVLPPPPAVAADGPQTSVAGIEPGFLLCVSRLLPYKNVNVAAEAFAGLDERLVIVGRGPEEARLRRVAPANVRLLGSVTDAELRWLYAASAGVVAAAYEDYGLTPLEAAVFGKPSAVLRFGGFLDTVTERTGVFFDTPEPAPIGEAVRELRTRNWDAAGIRAHAVSFSEERFIARLREIARTSAD